MLTRKYRPRKLSDIIGNEKAIARVRAWIEAWLKGKKQKPLLIYGPPGIGKTSIAYALANEYNLEILELSASELRNYERIKRKLGGFMHAQSLFGRKKIVLIDDVDFISRDDRGAVSTLAKLLRDPPVPVLLTANDAWDKKLAPLRSEVELLEMKRVSPRQIYALLKKIAEKEGIEVSDEKLREIAERSQGDVRSALNDLEARTSGYRDRKFNICDGLKIIFKAESLKKAKYALLISDVDHDTLKLWLSENIPNEYEKAHEVARAFHYLSRADVFDGRIVRRQYWGFLRYSSTLMVGGVALAKDEKYRKFTRYRFPKFLSALSKYQQRRAFLRSISEKISRKIHLPRKFVEQNISFYAKVVLSGGEHARLFYSLTEEEFKFLEGLVKA